MQKYVASGTCVWDHVRITVQYGWCIPLIDIPQNTCSAGLRMGMLAGNRHRAHHLCEILLRQLDHIRCLNPDRHSYSV
jgi:hypothetical protein